ncbi:peptidylprolyl isomerase [Bombella saccharophila]|uniref:Parvulin-like PPIase n=1 Tax=Bombella saccharophila TaxID=2967338 RepID=A0ABT3W8R7_9PROT|nr:peptidylprolyl isomerase [Bombella saccharophila]MCX5614038.1 SurA N-terminal domain-containing protein [Bombella saccharophila]
MITALRHFLVDSWLGRVLALLVFASFVVLGGTFFGIGGGAGLGGDVVVRIGGHSVTPMELQQAIQRQIAYAIQQNGGSPEILKAPQAREELGRAALRTLILTREGEVAGQRNGLTPSDDTIRAVVFSMPVFQDPTGKFDPQKMEAVLKGNQLDHQSLVNETRNMLYGSATTFNFGQGMVAPTAQVDWMVNFFTHGRVVDLIRLPFSLGDVATQPTDEQLKRYYQNHLWQFHVPEYRHARLVVMTAGSVAKTLSVSDEDVKAAYDQKMKDPAEAARYNRPELRTVEVLAVTDKTLAQKIAAMWKKGASWESLQKQHPSAIPASLNDARMTDFPDPMLGKAVFATGAGVVSDPIQTAAGWSVVHVVSVKPAYQANFTDMKDSLREDIANARAVPLLKERTRSLEEEVAKSATLDQIPADIGAFPLAGTMDEKGNIPGGEPAPLPGDAALREALLQQVFSQKKDEPPHIVTQPDGSAFAVLVDNIVPAHQGSYEEMGDKVKEAWLDDARKHAMEQRATSLYQHAKTDGLRRAVDGQSEASLLQKDEHFSRLQQRQDVPALILRAAMEQKEGETVMLQEGDAYWLVNVTGSYEESPTLTASLRQNIMTQMAEAYRADLRETLGMSYTRSAPPRHFNAGLFNDINNRVFSSVSGRLGQ